MPAVEADIVCTQITVTRSVKMSIWELTVISKMRLFTRQTISTEGRSERGEPKDAGKAPVRYGEDPPDDLEDPYSV